MRKTITKTYHKTRVNFSYVVITTGKTFTETIYLENWLNNMTFINTVLNNTCKYKMKEEAKVYSINSVEHVSVKAVMSDSVFESLATIDEQSIVVIKKLR